MVLNQDSDSFCSSFQNMYKNKFDALQAAKWWHNNLTKLDKIESFTGLTCLETMTFRVAPTTLLQICLSIYDSIYLMRGTRPSEKSRVVSPSHVTSPAGQRTQTDLKKCCRCNTKRHRFQTSKSSKRFNLI